MAWIESFEVQGLAGRDRPVGHTLDRGLNVFWGLNGAGKTTLLRILHAALKNEVTILDELPFQSARVIIRAGDVRIARSFSKKPVVSAVPEEEDDVFLRGDITIENVWVSETAPDRSRWESVLATREADVPTSYVNRGFTHCYLPITRVADGHRRAQRYATDGKLTADEVFVDQVRERWRDYSSKSLIRIREIQQQGLATVLAILFGSNSNAHGSTFGVDDVEPNEAYSLVRSFLSEQSIELSMEKDAFVGKFRKSPEHRQVVAEIQTVRSQTDEVLAPQQEFRDIIDSMYRGNKHLVLGGPRSPRMYGPNPIKVEIGDRAIPLKSLSSGEKQLLQILLEVLSADTSSVIVDEPELSLHVNWQQQLVSSMRRINADCQLLLASHSPEIMADVPDSHIFEL